jgi:hypothetical protein
MFAVLIGCTPSAIAQDTHTWKDVDCAQIRLAAAAGLKCRAEVYSGINSSTTAASGTFQQVTAAGTVNNVKLFYQLHEATSLQSSVTTRSTLAELLRGLSPQAKKASNFSELSTRNGVDFVTFTGSAGEACIGVRRFGTNTYGGYKWAVYATRCAPPKAAVSDSDISGFIAGTRPNA